MTGLRICIAPLLGERVQHDRAPMLPAADTGTRAAEASAAAI